MRVLLTSIERESTLLYTCCHESQEPWLSAPRLGAKLCHGCEIPSTGFVTDREIYCFIMVAFGTLSPFLTILFYPWALSVIPAADLWVLRCYSTSKGQSNS